MHHGSRPAKRVLVADADCAARAFYRRSFRRCGCDVVEAEDGREAMAKAFTRPPLLVVTELELPRVDGYTLCEVLRADQATTDVPILVVTAERDPRALERARIAGATVVLEKPAPGTALVRELRRLVLERSGARK